MSKLLAVVFCAAGLGACGEESEDRAIYIPFVYAERAAFDPALIGEVEVFIRDIASRWELELHEIPHEQLKMLHRDVPNPFNMMAYVEGPRHKKMIFWINNFGGGGDLLSLSMGGGGGLPRICVDRLHEELKSGLESRFGLDLYPVDKSGRRIEESGN